MRIQHLSKMNVKSPKLLMFWFTFWLAGVSCLLNMEGLKPGQFTRSSRLLSNGFLVRSKDDNVDTLSTILHFPVANRYMNSEGKKTKQHGLVWSIFHDLQLTSEVNFWIWRSARNEKNIVPNENLLIIWKHPRNLHKHASINGSV